MLVLSRKLGEKVVIGDGIVLTVVAIKGSQIRLGIQAPDDVKVWRGELLEADASPMVVTQSLPRNRELVLAK